MHPHSPASPTISASPLHARAWSVPLLVGLGIAGLSLGQGLLREQLFGVRTPWPSITIESFTRWLLYAAFAPLVGALVERYPLVAGRRSRRWPLHVAMIAGFSLAHPAAMALVYRLFRVYPPQDTVFEAAGRLMVSYFAVNLVIFVAISGVYHALRYHFEVVQREHLAAELRTRLLESRLEALKAQLNPHFLFNTLNAVSSLVLTGDRDDVARMLDRLGGLLRVSLDRSLPQEIPVTRELELLESYLDIQRVRFGERLTVVLRVAADASEAFVPSMVLQPLVENALRHGIESRPGPGRIAIEIRRDGPRLRVRVEDTGAGFGANGNDATRDGIGWSNTRARLTELYGAEARLEFGNVAEGGGFVEILMPFHKDPVHPGPVAREPGGEPLESRLEGPGAA